MEKTKLIDEIKAIHLTARKEKETFLVNVYGNLLTSIDNVLIDVITDEIDSNGKHVVKKRRVDIDNDDEIRSLIQLEAETILQAINGTKKKVKGLQLSDVDKQRIEEDIQHKIKEIDQLSIHLETNPYDAIRNALTEDEIKEILDSINLEGLNIGQIKSEVLKSIGTRTVEMSTLMPLIKEKMKK